MIKFRARKHQPTQWWCLTRFVSLRWCRISCLRKGVWSKWKVLTSWWPLTQSSSRRAPTSWTLQIQRQCKQCHCETLVCTFDTICVQIHKIQIVLQIGKCIKKLCLLDNWWCHSYQLQWKGTSVCYCVNISCLYLMEYHWYGIFFFQIYELRVMETKPDKAVSIIECDMNVRTSFFPRRTQTYIVLFAQDWRYVLCCFRWTLMLLWVTKSLNDDLITKKNQL